MARVFRIISRVTVLAVVVWESVRRHGETVVASLGSPGDVLAAGSACSERQELIRRYHDSLFAGHLGVSRTVYRTLDRVHCPGLRQDVRSYLASCLVCLARKSSCPRRAPMGNFEVGHRWDRVALDILDMSVTTPRCTGDC